jgi:hypothetical protein
MRHLIDASAESLIPFIRDSVQPGSIVHTDGWLGYLPVERNGYQHQVTFLKGKKNTPSELMPRVHRVVSLLKRWLLGTHGHRQPEASRLLSGRVHFPVQSAAVRKPK